MPAGDANHFGDFVPGRSHLSWRELANASDAGGVGLRGYRRQRNPRPERRSPKMRIRETSRIRGLILQSQEATGFIANHYFSPG